MEKGTLFVFAFVIIAVLLSSCAASFPTKAKAVTLTSEKAAELLKNKTEKEIHDNWGQPDGMLSGFYGDIYEYNGKSIVIYYDADSKVTDVLVSDQQN